MLSVQLKRFQAAVLEMLRSRVVEAEISIHDGRRR
jgi:hypothetical protein